MKYDFLVVGAGICGLTATSRLAIKGHSVLLVEQLHSIGGLCREEYYKGTRISIFGAHIFHTNDKEVWNFLSNFTDWDYYTHRVKSFCNGRLWSVPINYAELSKQNDWQEAILKSNLYSDYSKKMWGQYYECMREEIAARLIMKHPFENRYFPDKYQGVPANGYNHLFQNMIEMKNISVNLNYNFDIEFVDSSTPVIYTGRIDRLLGDTVLPFMSMRFEQEIDGEFPWSNEFGVINFPQDYDFIRAHSSKILYNQTTKHDVIIYEYPGQPGIECYPIIHDESKKLWKDINQKLYKKHPNVIPAGRAGKFGYYDMDEAVRSGIDAANDAIKLKGNL